MDNVKFYEWKGNKKYILDHTEEFIEPGKARVEPNL